MAEIILKGRAWWTNGTPTCAGCGQEFFYYRDGIHPTRRYSWRDECLAYRIKAGEYGSSGPELAEWAKQHRDCPDPIQEVSPSGVLVIDRRRTRSV